MYKSGSGQAAARITYLTGRTVHDQDFASRQLHYIKEHREDLVVEGTRNLPAWAGGDDHAYFRAAERYEGGGGKRRYNAFEEWKITLPHEFSREQNLALMDDLLTLIAGDRLPCTAAFHDPPTLSGSHGQPHLHLILSMRIIDGYDRGAVGHFRRWNKTDPEKGGAQKDPASRLEGVVKVYRVMISDMLNVHLECHGQVARVHPDSLASRGIDRPPEPKLLPSESAAYRATGAVSPRMQTVLDLRDARAQQPPIEQNNARQYWEQRKQFLGLRRDMPREAQVARIAALRHGTPLPAMVRSQPRRHEPVLSEDDLDKRWSQPLLGNKASRIYHLPTHKNYGDIRVENQVRFWTERAAQAAGYRRARNEYGAGADTPGTQRLARAQAFTWTQGKTRGLAQVVRPPGSVAQQLQMLRARMEEEQVGGGRRLRVRLHEDEQVQGRGW